MTERRHFLRSFYNLLHNKTKTTQQYPCNGSHFLGNLMKKYTFLVGLLLAASVHANSVTDALLKAQQNPTPLIEAATPQANTQEYGLAFIFSSTCPYCHQFAPTLKQFAQQTGLPVYAFSVDGRGLPQYPQPLTATNDILTTFYQTSSNATYPALFLVNLNNRKHVPLAIGNVPLTALNTTYQASLTYPHIKSRLQ